MNVCVYRFFLLEKEINSPKQIHWAWDLSSEFILPKVRVWHNLLGQAEPVLAWQIPIKPCPIHWLISWVQNGMNMSGGRWLIYADLHWLRLLLSSGANPVVHPRPQFKVAPITPFFSVLFVFSFVSVLLSALNESSFPPRNRGCSNALYLTIHARVYLNSQMPSFNWICKCSSKTKRFETCNLENLVCQTWIYKIGFFFNLIKRKKIFKWDCYEKFPIPQNFSLKQMPPIRTLNETLYEKRKFSYTYMYACILNENRWKNLY